MKLMYKKDLQEYKIYKITYDKNGYPRFLIYKNGQWLTLSSKNFFPADCYWDNYNDIYK